MAPQPSKKSTAWWPMIRSLHVYLTAKQVRLRWKSRLPWQTALHDLPPQRWNADDLASLMLDLPSTTGKWRNGLNVHLGSALCRFMIVDVPPSVTAPEERLAIARAQLTHRMGLDVSQWEVTLNTAGQGTSMLACAMRSNLSNRLRQMADANSLRLDSVKPFVASVWNSIDAKFDDTKDVPTALLAVEEDAFTVFQARGGHCSSVHTMTHSGEPDLVEREMKRLGLVWGGGVLDGMRLAVLSGSNFSTRADVVPVRHADFLAQARYPDFRELLFQSEEGV